MMHVEIGVQQRLAAADVDRARAEQREPIDAVEHQLCGHRLRVLVVLVAVRARQVAAADRNDLGEDRMSRGLECSCKHPNVP